MPPSDDRSAIQQLSEVLSVINRYRPEELHPAVANIAAQVICARLDIEGRQARQETERAALPASDV